MTTLLEHSRKKKDAVELFALGSFILKHIPGSPSFSSV